MNLFTASLSVSGSLHSIRGVTIMRYINLHFTYLLTYTAGNDTSNRALTSVIEFVQTAEIFLFCIDGGKQT